MENDNMTKSEENFDSDFDEILEGIPAEERHEVRRIMGMSMKMGGIISPEMELMKKMTPEHVTEFLTTQKKAMENQYIENRENKIFLFLVLLIVLAFIVILIILLKDNPEMMEKVLFSLGGLVTGLFGGYGLGRYKRDD